MTLGQIVKRAFGAIGIKAYSWKSLPWGISLERDLQRIFHDRTSLTLFDVGANVGQTAIRFCTSLPRSRIYCFEPVQASFEVLRENTKALRNVFIHKIALGNSCGSAKMTIFANSEENRLLVEDDCSNRHTEDVEMQTVDAIMEKLQISKIDLLKTDCEGFDLEVVFGAEKAIEDRHIGAILAEVSLKKDAFHTNFLAIHDHLQKRGFYFFAFYDYNGWGRFHSEGQFHNALWIREPEEMAPAFL